MQYIYYGLENLKAPGIRVASSLSLYSTRMATLLLLGLQKAAFSLDVSAFERFFFYKVVSAPPQQPLKTSQSIKKAPLSTVVLRSLLLAFFSLTSQ